MPRPRKPRVDSLAVSARVARALAAEFGPEEAQRVAAALIREPKTAKLDVRISPAKLEAYRAKAAAAGLTLTAWVERKLDADD
jgi:predicted DNA binding CopG/RHH family protein